METAASKVASILVVDDDAHIRTAVRVCLESEGYTVGEAADGEEALKLLRAVAFDVMLLDLAMPGVDGMTVLAELHGLGRDPGVRVIVFTAHGTAKAAMEAVRLGAKDFLEKPLAPQELRRSVAGVLMEAGGMTGAAAADYVQALTQVRAALRARELAAAERQLMSAGTISDEDPVFLNLAGVLHECHGRIDSARRFYERAAARDRTYRPAQENLRRLGELRQTGRTLRTMALSEDDLVHGVASPRRPGQEG